VDLQKTATRRRGQELEEALLTAAWDQLVEGGYRAFTLEAVADRAGTSRPVLYRRWKNRNELLVAAARFASDRDRPEVPDTGSLRGDFLALMEFSNRSRVDLAAVLSVQLGDYFHESGTSMADLRKQMLGERGTAMQTIMDRAVARGEVDPSRVTERITSLPFDLLRQEFIMTLKPVPQKVVEEILDEIFLPLVS
jgi:AcrR family transcriptional regulator